MLPQHTASANLTVPHFIPTGWTRCQADAGPAKGKVPAPCSWDSHVGQGDGGKSLWVELFQRKQPSWALLPLQPGMQVKWQGWSSLSEATSPNQEESCRLTGTSEGAGCLGLCGAVARPWAVSVLAGEGDWPALICCPRGLRLRLTHVGLYGKGVFNSRSWSQ